VHRRRRRRWRVWPHGRDKKKHTHGDYDGSELRDKKTPGGGVGTLVFLNKKYVNKNIRCNILIVG
jgi:hypothetical protein